MLKIASYWAVSCENPDSKCVAMQEGPTEADAITAWNTRAEPAPQPAEGAQKTCCICGAIMTKGVCLSCDHQECDQCPVYVEVKCITEADHVAAMRAQRAADLGPVTPEEKADPRIGGFMAHQIDQFLDIRRALDFVDSGSRFNRDVVCTDRG
jgi:hypothetical protein